jgi:hypothetical protein
MLLILFWQKLSQEEFWVVFLAKFLPLELPLALTEHKVVKMQMLQFKLLRRT